MKRNFIKTQRKITVIAIFALIIQALGFQSFQVLGQTPPKALLVLKNNKTVLINGTKALTGITVPSGTQIEALTDAQADVQILPLGTLKIFPKTKLLITYNNNDVQVKVESGCATLFMEPKFNGLVSTPKGEMKLYDLAQVSQVNSCDIVPTTNPPGNPGAGNPGKGVGGTGIPLPVFIAIIVGGGILTTYIIVKATDCNEVVSPSAPGC